METWVDVPDYEGLYKISSFGRLMSNRANSGSLKYRAGYIKKPQFNGNGYYFYNLYKNGVSKMFFVHRIVAICFIKNTNLFPEVNHKDGDKSNNKSSNLEWVTSSNNKKHAYAIGLMQMGDGHYKTKIKDSDILYIRKSLKSAKQLAYDFSVSISCIYKIRNLKNRVNV